MLFSARVFGDCNAPFVPYVLTERSKLGKGYNVRGKLDQN